MPRTRPSGAVGTSSKGERTIQTDFLAERCVARGDGMWYLQTGSGLGIAPFVLLATTVALVLAWFTRNFQIPVIPAL
jgi:hypothetical protein